MIELQIQTQRHSIGNHHFGIVSASPGRSLDYGRGSRVTSNRSASSNVGGLLRAVVGQAFVAGSFEHGLDG